MFEFFDPKQEYFVQGGRLPHWYQPGVVYFVTFRTADSVPQPLIRAWHADKNRWLRARGVDPSQRDWKARLAADPAVKAEFDRRFTSQFMAYLDQGFGACPLRRREAAEIVSEALLHFDGERYHLSDFVVMPNHVHVLFGMIGSTEIKAQCESWKRFSAWQINELIGVRGRFWQPESFDHLVRSPEQFVRFQRYIAENPEKAGLQPGEYLLWQRNVAGILRMP